jgi:hypothetical protein
MARAKDETREQARAAHPPCGTGGGGKQGMIELTCLHLDKERRAQRTLA